MTETLVGGSAGTVEYRAVAKPLATRSFLKRGFELRLTPCSLFATNLFTQGLEYLQLIFDFLQLQAKLPKPRSDNQKSRNRNAQIQHLEANADGAEDV